MKTMLFLALLVVGIQPSFGQTPIRLSFGDGEREFPLTSSPVFDRSGDYLITVLGPKVRVFATEDGALVRECLLPRKHPVRFTSLGSKTARPPRREGDDRKQPVRFTSLGSSYASNQVSLTSDGKGLVVIVGGGLQIFLFDVDNLIAGRNVAPRVVRYQPEHVLQPHHFVCSLGDDRLVFVTGGREHDDRLVLYRLGDERIDAGSLVDLHSKSSRTPEYLCCSFIANPLTFLAGPSADGTVVTALRVTPDSRTGKPWQRPSCIAERIAISWNESGYGTLKTGEIFRLPTSPVAVSPSLEQCMISSERSIGRPVYRQTFGIFTFNKSRNPLLVRSILGEEYHGVGRPGIWSGDSSRFFVNDGNHSRLKLPRVISVHDKSGNRVGALPLGEGLSGEVLATSNDGRFVVTRTVLHRAPRPKQRTPDKFRSAAYALWEIP